MKLDYSWGNARHDLLAGVTVAAISLPQAMAYALIAGVDPRFGLYSAIVVTLVASIFGSSSNLINGPTNAISLVVFSALAFFDPDARFDAYQATFLLGIMIGTIQILIAVFKLGDLTRYISESVVIGFMAGALVERSRGGPAQSWRSAPLRWLPAQSRWRARKAPQGALHLKRKREPEIRIINHEDLHLLTHPGGDRHDRHFAGARPTAGRSRRRLAKSRCQNHRR